LLRSNKDLGGFITGGSEDPRAANYGPAKSFDTACAMCDHFSSTDGAEGCCDIVAGLIRPDYTCDFFTAEQMGSEPQYGPVTAEFEVRKLDESKQLVFGWASVAVEKGGSEPMEDHHGDLIAPDDLEEAAYAFTLQYREGDEMHGDEVKAHLIESMVYTEEKLVKFATDEEGNVDADVLRVLKQTFPEGWWVGFYIPDPAVFAKVQSGEYQMFSIGGVAVREEAA
jgi:hypothetical protein